MFDKEVTFKLREKAIKAIHADPDLEALWSTSKYTDLRDILAHREQMISYMIFEQSFVEGYDRGYYEGHSDGYDAGLEDVRDK